MNRSFWQQIRVCTTLAFFGLSAFPTLAAEAQPTSATQPTALPAVEAAATTTQAVAASTKFNDLQVTSFKLENNGKLNFHINHLVDRATIAEHLSISPAVKNLSVYPSWGYQDTFSLGGYFRKNITYTLTLSAGLPEESGKHLGQDFKYAFTYAGESIPGPTTQATITTA
ncbi:TPA: hypothetical protein DDW35_09040, partial [Candidatus Sumerlaeota bacterium]|nr:hypothetical protein [Candidatus Sumerlaeota bacterium]